MIDDGGRYMTTARAKSLLAAEYLTYAAAILLTVRPTTLPGRRITIVGGAIADASPTWMIDGLDVREVTS